MEVAEEKDGLRILGKNKADGVSIAHLFSSQKMTYAQTDTFFVAAVDWKNDLANSLQSLSFTATTASCSKICFLNVIDVHGNNRADAVINRERNRITVEEWVIECNLEGEGNAFLYIENKQNGVSLDFNYDSNKGATTIIDRVDGKKVEKRLVDALPELEI